MKNSTDRALLIRAVGLALAGDVAGAHALVDPMMDDPTTNWLRACLHKNAGDEPRARECYRRSGQFYECYASGQAELQAIMAALTY